MWSAIGAVAPRDTTTTEYRGAAKRLYCHMSQDKIMIGYTHIRSGPQRQVLVVRIGRATDALPPFRQVQTLDPRDPPALAEHRERLWPPGPLGSFLVQGLGRDDGGSGVFKEYQGWEDARFGLVRLSGGGVGPGGDRASGPGGGVGQ